MSAAERFADLCRPGLEVWSLAIHEGLRSPFDEENALAADLNKRGTHLLAGRLAAHAALRALGHAPCPLLRGDEGEVLWPTGVTGSVSHTPDLAVAVAADAGRYAGVGVDVERRERSLDPGTARLIAPADEERAWLAAPPDGLVGDALVALTSAKEVVFKAYFPPTRVRLRYRDAVVTPTADGMHARVLPAFDLPSELPIERAEVGQYVVLTGALPRA